MGRCRARVGQCSILIQGNKRDVDEDARMHRQKAEGHLPMQNRASQAEELVQMSPQIRKQERSVSCCFGKRSQWTGCNVG